MRTVLDGTNTPGFIYAVSYWISIFMCILSNPERRPAKKVVPVCAAALVLLFGFMTATDGVPVVWFFPAMGVSFTILVLMMYFSCHIRLRDALFFTCPGFMMGEFMSSLGWQMIYYNTLAGGGQLRLTAVCRYMIPIYALFVLLFIPAGRKLRRTDGYPDLTNSEVITMTAIMLIMYLLSNASYALGRTPFTSTLPWEIFLIRTITDLSGSALCLIYMLLVYQTGERMQAESINQLLRQQYANYKIQKESIDLVNQKYHDLKHQIAILKNDVGADESRKYLNDMENDIRNYEAQNKTGNDVLDTILTSKSLTCQQKGITLTCVADGSSLSFMSPFDISALFGNALDNAMESAVKIEAPDQRLIHLQVSRQKNFVHISVENRYAGQLRFIHGLPVTSKKDHRYHGFGVRSIRQTAAKYGGSATVFTEDGWFRLNILIPFPAAGKKADI